MSLHGRCYKTLPDVTRQRQRHRITQPVDVSAQTNFHFFTSVLHSVQDEGKNFKFFSPVLVGHFTLSVAWPRTFLNRCIEEQKSLISDIYKFFCVPSLRRLTPVAPLVWESSCKTELFKLQGEPAGLRPGLGWLLCGCSTHHAQLLRPFSLNQISPSRIRQTVREPKSKSTQPKSETCWLTPVCY